MSSLRWISCGTRVLLAFACACGAELAATGPTAWAQPPIIRKKPPINADMFLHLRWLPLAIDLGLDSCASAGDAREARRSCERYLPAYLECRAQAEDPLVELHEPCHKAQLAYLSCLGLANPAARACAASGLTQALDDAAIRDRLEDHCSLQEDPSHCLSRQSQITGDLRYCVGPGDLGIFPDSFACYLNTLDLAYWQNDTGTGYQSPIVRVIGSEGGSTVPELPGGDAPPPKGVGLGAPADGPPSGGSAPGMLPISSPVASPASSPGAVPGAAPSLASGSGPTGAARAPASGEPPRAAAPLAFEALPASDAPIEAKPLPSRAAAPEPARAALAQDPASAPPHPAAPHAALRSEWYDPAETSVAPRMWSPADSSTSRAAAPARAGDAKSAAPAGRTLTVSQVERFLSSESPERVLARLKNPRFQSVLNRMGFQVVAGIGQTYGSPRARSYWRYENGKFLRDPGQRTLR